MKKLIILISSLLTAFSAHAGLGRNDHGSSANQYQEFLQNQRHDQMMIRYHNISVLNTFNDNYKTNRYPQMQYEVYSAIFDSIQSSLDSGNRLNLDTILNNIIHSDGSLK